MEGGTPGPIRTAGLLLRRQTLYPAELRAHTNTPIVALWVGRGKTEMSTAYSSSCSAAATVAEPSDVISMSS
jgi:hypothetical protein